MELSAIQTFTIIHLSVIGLSHIVAHRAWARFFIDLTEKGTTGVIAYGFIMLGFGSVIAAWHPIWSGIPLIITLLGWSQVIKGGIYLSFPAFGLRRLRSVSLERSWVFAVPGVAFVVLAGVLAYALPRG